MKPQDLLFSETHEWVSVANERGQKVATIGITAFAAEQLTDIVFLELPEVGRSVTAEGEFGEVESVKAVSPLYSPVSGEIISVNKELRDALDKISHDPYGEGWIIKVKLSDESDLSKLLNYEQYQKQCAEGG